MRRIAILSLCLGVWFGFDHQGSEAQWLVEDAAALAQRTGIWAQEAAQWAQSLGNQVKEIQAQYNIILNQIKQVEWMVQQSQRIPAGMNILNDITLWSNQLTGLLGNANIISYNMTNVVGEFDHLY